MFRSFYTNEFILLSPQIQVALRHKSEIEHHRNKIRLRAKRKGHYDFPAMDDVTYGIANGKDQDQIYQKAQTQVDKIMEPEAQMPMSIFTGSKKRSGHEMMVCVSGYVGWLHFTLLTVLHFVCSVVVQDALPNRGWRSSWMEAKGKQIKTSWSLRTTIVFTEGVQG